MSEQKYITVNGVMKKNPKYVSDEIQKPTTTSDTLAVVSSPDDIIIASDIQAQNTGVVVPMASSTSDTFEMMQDAEMLEKYKSRVPLDGGDLLDKIGHKFARYETPLGMINKLMMLTAYKLDFLVDDSGSMSAPTDVDAIDATEPVKSVIREKLGREPRPGEKMTRIQEAEDRLHIMVGILAYLPVEYMQVRFLNDRTPSILQRTGETPEEFEVHAHKEIRRRFAALKLGSTPVRDPLQIGFNYPGKWSHYLFNDGVPNEGGPAIAQQIISRKKPEDHALTLISCTDEDDETLWMKEVDGKASYVAEVDDYGDESVEVKGKQGEAFPFTRGLWILCQLVASINPFDLDALDENLPLTCATLSNILGRQLNPNEYQYYFERNPNAVLYVKEYSRFLGEELFARQIISTSEQERREKSAGYHNGERPKGPLANISSKLAPITEKAYQAFMEKYSANPSLAQPAAPVMSSVTIAPYAAFMSPPQIIPTSYPASSYESPTNGY